MLHAGGKFGGENSGYKVSGGLHGVGASVVNALSEWLEVVVRRDGNAYQQSFHRGVPDGDLKNLGPTDGQTGTTVTFKPDPEMFEVLEYDYDILCRRLREEAFLNAGVRITLTDERPGMEKTESMCYEGGIRSFVEYINTQNKLEVLHPDVIYLKGQLNDSVAEVALQYNDSFNERVVSSVSYTHLDVYKRQSQGLPAWCQRKPCKVEVYLKEWLSVNLFLKNGRPPRAASFMPKAGPFL